jgi:hypothetical protein
VAVLWAAVIAFGALVAPVAAVLSGQAGVAACAAAALACLAGATVALIAACLLRGPAWAMYGLLIGMTARLGIPLAVGLAIDLCGHPLAEAGLIHYLLVFYPITLVVGTGLSLPADRPPGKAGSTRDVVV